MLLEEADQTLAILKKFILENIQLPKKLILKKYFILLCQAL